ncbi:MAG: hypothetical protein KDD33_02415 [Bdellovibrionales bacterium]|nr:hypothetical protein [Bdellovibrionales bacterium]
MRSYNWVFATFLIIPSLGLAQSRGKGGSTNDLAISQGISSPSYTNVTTVSNGFTFDNPVGASYQKNYRATAFIDGSTSTSLGIDGGVGDSQYGLGLAYYSNSCDGCDGYIRGTMSAIWGGFGMGFGVREDVYTMGMMFNPNGLHRVGLVIEYEDPAGRGNNRTGWGLGYSYVTSSFTFSMDMSNQALEDNSLDDGSVLITPAVGVRVDIFAATLSYNFYFSDSTHQFSDGVWVGLSAKPFSKWQFTFYGEFIDRWTLMASYYF